MILKQFYQNKMAANFEKLKEESFYAFGFFVWGFFFVLKVWRDVYNQSHKNKSRDKKIPRPVPDTF